MLTVLLFQIFLHFPNISSGMTCLGSLEITPKGKVFNRCNSYTNGKEHLQLTTEMLLLRSQSMFKWKAAEYNGGALSFPTYA